MIKLNLGCGFDKRDGFVNADNFSECEPDVHIDIEQTPWPLADNSFDYILMKHVLEHVGADFKTFACVMRELYRVTAPGASLTFMCRTSGTTPGGLTRPMCAHSRR